MKPVGIVSPGKEEEAVNLSKKDQEKLVFGIQLAIGIAAVWMSVRGNTKATSKRMKKVLDQDARRLEKLHRIQFRMEKKELKRKYRQKAKRNKLNRA